MKHDKFKQGDLVSIPKHLHTSTSMEKTEGKRVGVYVRYCGDNCGVIKFENGEEVWNVGWMKPVKKVD